MNIEIVVKAKSNDELCFNAYMSKLNIILFFKDHKSFYEHFGSWSNESDKTQQQFQYTSYSTKTRFPSTTRCITIRGINRAGRVKRKQSLI